ncbi:TPA: hypothetical protein ACPJ2S_001934 [Vibrio alginolyticus]
MKNKYGRKFFIAKPNLDFIPDWATQWKKVSFTEKFNCFIHPDLNVIEIESELFKVIIIGSHYYIEDANEHLYKNIKNAVNLDDIFKEFRKVSGRYTVCLSESRKDKNLIFSDALSLRQVFYAYSGQCIVASDINLLIELNGFRKDSGFDHNSKSFYDNELKKVGTGNCWIGNDTIYKNIKKLPPNHYFNIDSYITDRYWPKKSIIRVDKELAATSITKYLKKILVDLSKEGDLTMAVTAGYDSRVLFAASKDEITNIEYFIDKKETMSSIDNDIVIGRRVVEKYGYDLNVNYHSDNIKNIPKDFVKLYYDSCFYSGITQLPTVYFYYENYRNKINICGVGEIGRHRFGKKSFKPTAGFLAYKYGYINSDYAKNKAQEWLDANYEICSLYRVNPYTLFYWEEDLGNWGAVGNSESDIAIEEINPYNCHEIFELMLGVDWSSSKLRDNELFDRMINIFDPSLSEIPINPVYKRSDKIKRKLMNSFFYQYLDYSKYCLLRFLK